MPESVPQERYSGYTLEVNAPERYNTNFFVCDFYWANSSGGQQPKEREDFNSSRSDHGVYALSQEECEG